MIKIDLPEENLVRELALFRELQSTTLQNMIVGLELAMIVLKTDNEKDNVLRVTGKINNLLDMLTSFTVGISDTKLYVIWNNKATGINYDYSEKILTEKMFCFLLLSYEKEISENLSNIEKENYGYIDFCETIKHSLHRIITDYITW